MYSGLEVFARKLLSLATMFAVSQVAEAAAVAGCFYVCGGWDGRQSVSQTHSYTGYTQTDTGYTKFKRHSDEKTYRWTMMDHDGPDGFGVLGRPIPTAGFSPWTGCHGPLDGPRRGA